MNAINCHPKITQEWNLFFSILTLLAVAINTSCTKDDPQDSLQPIEQTTVTLGSEGGTIILGTNVQVIIPPGALNHEENITISRYKPEDFFDGDVSNYTIIGCEPEGLNFSAEVEIYFIAPPNLDPLKTEGLAGYIEPESNALEVYPTYGLTIDGQSSVMIKTTHFSKYGGWFWETPPHVSSKLEVPHYNQGSSTYCWAAGIQMVCDAIAFDPNKEISDIVGYLGVNEEGIGQYEFRFGPKVANTVKERVNKNPDRKIWPALSVTTMDSYLKDRLALGFPVLVYSPVEEHAFLIVGYDGNTFYLNDPASTEYEGNLTMKTKEWVDFKIADMESNAKFVTLSIPIILPAEKHLKTVNIGPGEFYFKMPDGGFESSKISYKYSYTSKAGYEFRNFDGGLVDSIPGNAKELNLKNIQLANSSLTQDARFTVQTTIFNKNEPSKNYISTTTAVSVKANSMGFYSLTVPIDKFQSTDKHGTYTLLVEAWDGSSTIDKQRIDFILKKPEEAVEPVNHFNGTKFYIYFYGDLIVKDKATLQTYPQYYTAGWGAEIEKRNGAVVTESGNKISSSYTYSYNGEAVKIDMEVDNIDAPTMIRSLYYESKINSAGVDIFKSVTAHDIPISWGTVFEHVNIKKYITQLVYIENTATEEKTLGTTILDSDEAKINGKLIE